MNNPVQTFNKDKAKHSAVFYFYLRVLIIALLGEAIFIFFDIKDPTPTPPALFTGSTMVVLVFAIIIGLIDKGSLVDSVTIDQERGELRLKHYSLLGRAQESTIRLEGMLNEYYNPHSLAASRLRIYAPDGRQFVICENSCGWLSLNHKKSQFARLHSALCVLGTTRE